MTTEVETGVRPAHLLDYNKRALKLVGIDKNGKPSMKWGPIYDNQPNSQGKFLEDKCEITHNKDED